MLLGTQLCDQQQSAAVPQGNEQRLQQSTLDRIEHQCMSHGQGPHMADQAAGPAERVKSCLPVVNRLLHA